MIEKGISLILPTRDRPKLAYRLLKSIRETASNIDKVEVVLYLDEDDEDSQQIDYPGVSLLKIIGNEKRMGAMNDACYTRSHGEFIMLVNDDMLFRTKNWDLTIVKEFARFADGIVLLYGNDRYYGQRIPTFPILSRTVCGIMGHICPVEYKRHCIDPHILDVFSRLTQLGHDRCIYLPKVVFEHMHYELSTAAYDTQERFIDDKEDQKMFSALAIDRQNIAIKLAAHIESYASGVKCKPRRVQ